MLSLVPKTEHNPLYDKLEEVLRQTVREALLDDGFGDFFRDYAAAAARWKC
jgi:hypothetical protein